MNVSVILPSLNPNEQLLDVVNGLLSKGFQDIIIVNDGSNEEHMGPFLEVAKHPEVTVLTHEVNRGKGRGLKTAFEYCLKNRPDIDGVITVDGDNQHTTKAIMDCCQALVEHPDTVILGCRNFKGKDVPWKSRVGNTITTTVFRLLCRIKLSDTQTGLRAFPRSLLEFLIGIRGERFEYETQVLLEMQHKRIPFLEVPIETVYIKDNSETHFHWLKDSVKIYRVIIKFLFRRLLTFLKFSVGSILSFLIDIAIFYLTEYLVGTVWHIGWQISLPKLLTAGFMGAFVASLLGDQTHMISTVTSRVLSSVFNYCFNRNMVFKDKTKHTVWKYYLLALIQMLLSGLLVTVFAYLFKTSEAWQATLVKMAVDFVLFIGSYQVQHRWVFAGRKATGE